MVPIIARLFPIYSDNLLQSLWKFIQCMSAETPRGLGRSPGGQTRHPGGLSAYGRDSLSQFRFNVGQGPKVPAQPP